MRLRNLLRHPFDRVKITPLGKYFSIFTLLFGIAAINSGNNLLYLILSYLLILLFASGIFSTVNLVGLKVRWHGQENIYREKEGIIYLEFRKNVIPSFLLYICTDAGCTFIPFLSKKWKPVRVPYKCEKRGIHHLNRVYVYSLYPFGFANRGVYVNTMAEVLVYPRVDIKVNEKEEHYLVVHGDEYGGKRGYEGEFKGLKRYETGERIFHIHWKKSLKELNVKEFEGVQSRVTFLKLSDKPVDVDIDRVASLAHEIIGSGGSVGLMIEGSIVVPPGAGKKHEEAILRVLALL